jgi:hypothetical protein
MAAARRRVQPAAQQHLGVVATAALSLVACFPPSPLPPDSLCHVALSRSREARSTNFAAAPTIFVSSPLPGARSASVDAPTPSNVFACSIGSLS